MNVTFEKLSGPKQADGRGQDNFRQPARYGVRVGGELKGYVWAKPAASRQSATWEIASTTGKNVTPLKTIWKGGRKAAFAWASTFFQTL